jgi:hypothetical protein
MNAATSGRASLREGDRMFGHLPICQNFVTGL